MGFQWRLDTHIYVCPLLLVEKNDILHDQCRIKIVIQTLNLQLNVNKTLNV